MVMCISESLQSKIHAYATIRRSWLLNEDQTIHILILSNWI